MKKYKVRYTYSQTSQPHKRDYFDRIGIEVYRHPKGYFVTLEFQGKLGKFRESFRPGELMPV